MRAVSGVGVGVIPIRFTVNPIYTGGAVSGVGVGVIPIRFTVDPIYTGEGSIRGGGGGDTD